MVTAPATVGTAATVTVTRPGIRTVRDTRTAPAIRTASRADRSGRSRRRASCSASRSDSERPASCFDRCSADRFSSPPRWWEQSPSSVQSSRRCGISRCDSRRPPASTLESAVTDEATAVTSFDQNGQGIVSLEVDGQVVQILATLRADDRLLPTRVRAGQRVSIDDVNVAKNSCTVSLI